MSIPVTLSYIDSEGKQHLAPDISAERNGYLDIIDQTLLPREQKRLKLETPEAVYEAIKQLRVRGAPAIGCSAAIGLAVKEGSPFPHTLSLALTNGTYAYFVTEEEMPYGGYEVDMFLLGNVQRFAPHIDRTLADLTLAHLDTMKIKLDIS